MAARKNGKQLIDTTVLIEAIHASHDAAKVVADAVASELLVHTKLDDVRHEENKQRLTEIASDVKSLLESRSFTKGIFRAMVGIAVTVSTVVGLIIAWIKG